MSAEPAALPSRLPIVIMISGIPAPQGSKRHVGGGRMVEASKAVGPWREAVRAETQRSMGTSEPLAGPVHVNLMFWLKRPANHFGTGRNAGMIKDSAPLFPAVLPDLDKLVRSSLDGIVAGGAIGDDRQVCTLSASKWYAFSGRPPGCRIVIAEEGA